MRAVALFGLILALLAACEGAEGVGTWRDEQGRTLESFSGPEHCDWQSVTFLHAEAGLLGGAVSERLQFLRDPEGLFEAEVVVPYDADATLPEDAVDTGFRLDDLELWAERDRDAVYALKEGSVERWPRTRSEIACA